MIRLGRVVERPEFEEAGWSYLDHALDTGFFDDPDAGEALPRHRDRGFLDNLEARTRDTSNSGMSRGSRPAARDRGPRHRRGPR